MSKARELAELSRTVSDSADATAITINSSEEVTFADDIFLADGKKVVLGADSDLQIYHDGLNSYIADNGTGGLTIQANADFLVQSTGSNENMIYGATNAFVKLFYNGLEKLATTSTGIDVTGSVTADGLTVAGDSALTGGSSGSTVLTLTSNALADTPLMVFQRSGGAVAGKLAYEDTNTAISFGTTTAHELKLLTNNTNRLEIDSSGNSTFSGSVTADAGRFDNQASTPVRLHINNSGTNDYASIYADTASAYKNLVINPNGGSVLVGKTAVDFGVAGITLFNNGASNHVRAGGAALSVRRLTDDGSIIDFYGHSSGSAVGSIGVDFGDRLFIQTGDTGLFFNNASDALQPYGSGNLRDAGIDIGTSGYRFKDLYLSSGVFLGGTGSANKISDYEEGTFLPTITGVGTPSYSNRNGWYCKVGDTVHFTLQLLFGNVTSSSNFIAIGGLPFTTINSANYYPVPSVFIENGITDTQADAGYSALVILNTNTINVYAQFQTKDASSGVNYDGLRANNLTASTSNSVNRIRVSGSYKAA